MGFGHISCFYAKIKLYRKSINLAVSIILIDMFLCRCENYSIDFISLLEALRCESYPIQKSCRIIRFKWKQEAYQI